MSEPLPIISMLNSLMTVQAYLRSATTATLPPVIAQDPQYDILVTNFRDWQEGLWSRFWEGLLDEGIISESAQVNQLFNVGVDDQGAMQSIFYDGAVPIVVSHCDEVANCVTNGQGLLQQLEGIAHSIEGADQSAVNQLIALTAQLSKQFDQQEETLTQGALNSASDVVATAIDVLVAIGTEGEEIEPLVKSVTKLASDATNQLALTDEINQTLSELEDAWEALDQASADLTQIKLACNQLDAVTKTASTTLQQLQQLSTDWTTVAETTQAPASAWSAGGSTALLQWAAQMVTLSFSNATQAIDASATASQAKR